MNAGLASVKGDASCVVGSSSIAQSDGADKSVPFEVEAFVSEFSTEAEVIDVLSDFEIRASKEVKSLPEAITSGEFPIVTGNSLFYCDQGIG